MGTPAVSVVMPTCNRVALVQRAIDSVRAQTLEEWELIVIDDNSGDDTVDIVEGIAKADPRVRLLRCVGRGAPAARNQGIDAARASLIAFLDDDDEWLPQKLERQLGALVAAGSAFGLVHAAFEHVGPGGTSQRAGTWGSNDGFALRQLVRGNQLGHSTVMARTDLLKAVGGFDVALPRLQDWDLWLRLSARTRFVHVDEPLARIHYTHGSISTDVVALRVACEHMAATFACMNGFGRADRAELCYALALLLARNGLKADARRLIRRSLSLRPWPLTRLAGAALLYTSAAAYSALAGARSGR